MFSKKVLVSISLGWAVVLVVSGCSTAASNVPAGSVADQSASSGSSSGQSSSVPVPTKSAVSTVAALPFNASGYLAGNVTPTLDAGEAGAVSVVSTAALKRDDAVLGGGTLPFAFRNNTGATISHIDFTGTATVDGKVVATGASQGTVPAHVKPGEMGFSYLYLEDVKSLPDSGAQYDFRASTMPADNSSFNTAPLKVTQADNNGSAIIGSAVNSTGKPLSGPYAVDVYCFTDGALSSAGTMDFATETGDVAPDGTVSFSHDLYDSPCDSFVVGVSGYFA